MEIEIKIPSVGESVQEAVIAEWYKKDGDRIQKDEPLFVIETDKVTLEIVAEADGIVKKMVPENETIAIGAVVGTITTEAVPVHPTEPAPPKKGELPPVPLVPTDEPPPALAEPESEPSEPATPLIRQILPPSVRRLVAEKNIELSAITGTGPGNRVTKGDILLYLEQAQKAVPSRELAIPEYYKSIVCPKQ